MRFLSLFSGIEAASVAWKPLGWECVGVAEIEKFPSRVLAHHYPDVPNLGDITKITEEQIKALGHIDLVVGGFPCQDLSIAGKRKGLKNEDGSSTRSGLFYDAMRIVRWSGARYCLIENVPGMLSSNSGEDFASVVGEMVGASFTKPKKGWKTNGLAVGKFGLLEWTVLDAQWFGLAQRRRRVFALLDTGNWQARQPILLERESLSGDTQKSREERQSTSTIAIPSVAGSLDTECGGGKLTHQSANAGHIFPVATFDRQSNSEYGDAKVASTVNARDWKAPTDLVTVYETHPADSRVKEMGEVCQTVTSRWGTGGGNVPIATHAFKVRGGCEGGGKGYLGSDEVAFTLSTNQDQQLYTNMRVRRLTPKECERLQGFPDNYTNIPNAPDSGRYKALGNSMAVPCMRWIGQRIQAVESGE